MNFGNLQLASFSRAGERRASKRGRAVENQVTVLTVGMALKRASSSSSSPSSPSYPSSFYTRKRRRDQPRQGPLSSRSRDMAFASVCLVFGCYFCVDALFCWGLIGQSCGDRNTPVSVMGREDSWPTVDIDRQSILVVSPPLVPS